MIKYKEIPPLYTKLFSLYLLIISFIVIASLAFGYYKIAEKSLNSQKVHNVTNAIPTIVTPAANIITLNIKKRDTLASILYEHNVSLEDSHKIISALKQFYNLKKLHIGQEITLDFNKKYGEVGPARAVALQQLQIKTDPRKEIVITRNDSGNFDVKEVEIPLTRYLTRIQGAINNSFMATAHNLGIPSNALMELVKAYSFDVDFQRDIKVGDEINVVYERFYDEQGEFSHNGNIIYASLSLTDRNVELYRYSNSLGEEDFYSKDGHSVKKDLLRTPISVVRISSPYGMRHHPILGYSKLHKGVDFAAPTGTPILAAGNGIIEEMGHKGAYGNYIRLKHANGYSTAYAHASSFNKKLRRGQTVKQGEVIAYVGTTGRSTGPHLHYEVLVNNQQINPLKVKVSAGQKLNGKELSLFNRHKKSIEKLLTQIPNLGELAMQNTNSTTIAALD
jgi:murein DD-endopeptidase MepM/ murein hydrolase activator NlpD